MRSQFWGKNYYEILNVKPSATLLEIRSAFRKLALKLHPDKVEESIKAQATLDFQYLINVVDILSDPNKKALYDLTKDDVLTQEQHTTEKPSNYYHQRFVTVADILAHQEKYVGSDEEVNDVISAYVKYKGNMTAIIETIMHSTQDDSDRFRVIIDTALRTGITKMNFPIYFGPSEEIDVTEDRKENTGKLIDKANEQGYFEEEKETNFKKEETGTKRPKIDNHPEGKETKLATTPEQSSLQSGMSMRERNYHRIMNLCSSLERRFKPRNHVEPTITEEEFQRAAAKLESRRRTRSGTQQTQTNKRKRK